MPLPRQSAGVLRPHVAGDRPDRIIAALAARQHGVVVRRQLLDAGLTRDMLKARLASRRLLPLHRGVYAVGHRHLRREGYRLAAVLATGPGALLSHREAAALHALRPAAGATIDVTVAARRRVPGVAIHRVERIDPRDATTVDGIPVTSVARTLVDLAAAIPPAELRKALEEAERSHRLDVRAIEEAMGRIRGRTGMGCKRMRWALRELASVGAAVTRSVLEGHFLALVDAYGLPQPAANAWTESMEVDAVWPAARLAVELDGWDAHKTRDAFQRDRTRSNDLQAAGWTILRFTHADVVHRADETGARVARILAQAARATG